MWQVFAMKSSWPLQDAKNQFSRVVECAASEGAQMITKHGKPAAVVLSAADYAELRADRPRLVDVLRDCPVADLAIERIDDRPQDMEL
jgi:prevent-host-death family protein